VWHEAVREDGWGDRADGKDANAKTLNSPDRQIPPTPSASRTPQLNTNSNVLSQHPTKLPRVVALQVSFGDVTRAALLALSSPGVSFLPGTVPSQAHPAQSHVNQTVNHAIR
jgi:hypothetical protein